jgi:hypothetical protein
MVNFCCGHTDGRIRIFDAGGEELLQRKTSDGSLTLVDARIERTEVLG